MIGKARKDAFTDDVIAINLTIMVPMPERWPIACNDRGAKLAAAPGRDRKCKLSLMVYVAAMLLAVLRSWIGIAHDVAVAMRVRPRPAHRNDHPSRNPLTSCMPCMPHRRLSRPQSMMTLSGIAIML
jgi:hypothetical protein